MTWRAEEPSAARENGGVSLDLDRKIIWSQTGLKIVPQPVETPIMQTKGNVRN